MSEAIAPPRDKNERKEFSERPDADLIDLLYQQTLSDGEITEAVDKLKNTVLSSRNFSSQPSSNQIWFIIKNCLEQLPDIDDRGIKVTEAYYRQAQELITKAQQTGHEKQMKLDVFESIDKHEKTDILRIIQQTVLERKEKRSTIRMTQSQQRTESYKTNLKQTNDFRSTAVEAFRHVGAIFLIRDSEIQP